MTDFQSAIPTIIGAISGASTGLLNSLPPMFILVRAFCLITGVVLLIHAFLRLRNTQTKAPTGEKVGTILWQILFAVALINLNLFLASGAETIFGSSDFTQISPISYQPSGSGLAGRAQSVLITILAFIQFVGYVSFARGLLELNNHANGKANSSLGKGLTHVVGGILASNMILTSTALGTTFFPNVTL